MSLPRPSEIRAQVAGSAAFRLTLRFAAVFAFCLLVLGLAAGFGARWLVASDIRGEVAEALDALLETEETGGAAALGAALRRVEGADVVAGHLGADGRLLAGSLSPPRLSAGWSEFLPPGVDDDETLWMKAMPLPDGTWLAAAASSESYHDIVELMETGAIWILLIALPLGALSGALLGLAVMRRLAPIAATAHGVRDGALSRRAPVGARMDEFDRLAADINAMLDRIEGLNRNLRNVTVGIAHELRTPLARARNRLVEMQGEDREDIAAVLAEIDGLLATFDALLKIGQIEADAERRGFEEVDLSALTSVLAETYEPVAAEQGKRLIARIAGGIRLRGNRALLTQMVSNLIENAIEHTPPGTEVRLGLERNGDGPVLTVEDNGPGIPEPERERVFERFYRLGDAVPGNGLGLSLVRSICGLHGLRVGLAPSEAGARFRVSM